ncbi:RadC family protein [Vibrio fluvialis]|uniref:RadC family protein n=2 Tax=Vibrionaceae TaxID=641 RepID=UPI001EEA21A2|nr:DNA repair protein RadC [Vibrio fluvialis]
MHDWSHGQSVHLNQMGFLMSVKEMLENIDVSLCSIEECAAIYSLANRLAKYQMSNLTAFSKPDDARNYLQNAYMGFEYEIFGVIFLDNQNRILATKELFRGTIDSASIYPREVAKLALKHNAAACMFFHNHPSGAVEPSNADRKITERLKDALDLLNIRVLDHFVVGREGAVSFVERGFL